MHVEKQNKTNRRTETLKTRKAPAERGGFCWRTSAGFGKSQRAADYTEGRRGRQRGIKEEEGGTDELWKLFCCGAEGAHAVHGRGASTGNR